MSNDDEDRSKLLQTIPDKLYGKIIDKLNEYRRIYTAYPDHELLVFMVSRVAMLGEKHL